MHSALEWSGSPTGVTRTLLAGQRAAACSMAQDLGLLRHGPIVARRCRTSRMSAVEAALSVAMLGCFLWAMRFLLPNALKARDPLAVVSAVVTAVLALITWLLVAVRLASG
mgnify:CR=1 FL=1